MGLQIYGGKNLQIEHLFNVKDDQRKDKQNPWENDDHIIRNFEHTSQLEEQNSDTYLLGLSTHRGRRYHTSGAGIQGAEERIPNQRFVGG